MLLHAFTAAAPHLTPLFRLADQAGQGLRVIRGLLVFRAARNQDAAVGRYQFRLAADLRPDWNNAAPAIPSKIESEIPSF